MRQWTFKSLNLKSLRMKRTSHIEEVRRELARTKMQVQTLLGWSDLAYARFQESAGIEYLKKEFEEEELVKWLSSTKHFWSWWRMQWLKRDREFLEASGTLFPNEYDLYYKEIIHQETGVYYPHRVVMESKAIVNPL